MKTLIILISAILSACVLAQPSQLDAISEKLIQKTIPTVDTQELAQRLLKQNKPILLDTRQRKEYDVSHIPGAIWVGYKEFDIKAVRNWDKNLNIVVYCSVGYRSEKIGERLKAAGFKNVSNLFAGIFAWSNEGRTMENSHHQKTKNIHGYDAEWAQYLKSSVNTTLK